MRYLACLLLLALPLPALADVLVTSRTLRAGTLITADDLSLIRGTPPPGAATNAEAVIGLEARVTLYAGRPVPLGSLTEPALVERNQLVSIIFQHGGLEIRADGRALGRGGAGESIRIMNLASRNTVSGRVAAPGIVVVHP
ncbi:flagellar basal body P-ring formation chaperone FlgA [Pararhodobacter sp.]|uniref:flagellar basal body P-ring formation chaperone FlgA n=1 Tax=Pararhodobacter sp. TaxID=2127056 RepID=UPI002FDCCBB9